MPRVEEVFCRRSYGVGIVPVEGKVTVTVMESDGCTI